MKYSCLKRLLATVLVVAMILGTGVSGAYAVGDSQAKPVSFTELDPDEISVDLKNTSNALEEEETTFYSDTDMVRGTIVLQQESALTVMGLGRVEGGGK